MAIAAINTQILIKKLNLAGIRGRFLKIFESYLTNRRQYVCLNNNSSNILPINIGVPQGSVLGPLFFIIFINDFGKLKLNGDLRLYADDSALFYSNTDINHNINAIESDLKVISEYLSINKLTLNINKSNFINFCTRQNRFQSPSSISFNNGKIFKIEKVKYLGLIIDQHLSWVDHINYICSKVSPMIGIISKLRHFLPKPILLNIYYSFIHCRFEYLALNWGATYKLHLYRLQVLQNRALKFIFNKDWLFNTLDLYKNVSKTIIPIYSIYLFQLYTFIFKVLNNKIYNNLCLSQFNHNYNTRNRNNLILPLINTNFGKFSISFSGPKLYNNLPKYIKENTKCSSFKKDILSFLMSYEELTNSLS